MLNRSIHEKKSTIEIDWKMIEILREFKGIKEINDEF